MEHKSSKRRPITQFSARVQRTKMNLGPVAASTELSMGPFYVTRFNATYQLTDPAEPNPLQVEKFGPNPILTVTG